jgi:hypothetical protein
MACGGDPICPHCGWSLTGYGPPAIEQPVTTSEIAPGAVVQIFVHPYVRQEPSGVDTTTYSFKLNPELTGLKEEGRDA